jgi:signal transduction histidine kinase
MRVPFRYRIFLGLLSLGTLPLAAALVVLALQVRSTGSPAGPRAALDDVAQSGRTLIADIDTLALTDDARIALRAHTETIARATTLARRAEALTRTAAGALGVTILLAAAVLVGLSIHLARNWSLQISRPIEELITWTQRIERGERLPTASQEPGGPEFASLRSALHDMSAALHLARQREIERERLVAFRETARRVAHEIRGPLSSAGLALSQLERHVEGSTALEVLRDEYHRLEIMAREFAEFGRLPEGPRAAVDVGALLAEVIQTSIPADVPVVHEMDDNAVVSGYYEPLRRAFRNLMENAAQATSSEGIAVSLEAVGASPPRVCVRISDHGPGVPAELHARIFEPYFTTKEKGTGLGLALVRQAVETHEGTIVVSETPGGGATFTVNLPGGE